MWPQLTVLNGICVVTVDVAPLIAAAGDMPDGTWKLETKLTGHGAQERARREGDSVRGEMERYYKIGGET
jgi:hypothetical protein